MGSRVRIRLFHILRSFREESFICSFEKFLRLALTIGVTAYELPTRIAEGAGGETAREPTKPTKMITEQESNFWKAFDKPHYSTKLLKNTFE